MDGSEEFSDPTVREMVENRTEISLRIANARSHPESKLIRILRLLWCINDTSVVINAICARIHSAGSEKSILASVWEECLPLIDFSSLPSLDLTLFFYVLDITCEKAQAEVEVRNSAANEKEVYKNHSKDEWRKLIQGRNQLQIIRRKMCSCDPLPKHCRSLSGTSVNASNHKNIVTIMQRWKSIEKLWQNILHQIRNILRSEVCFEDITSRDQDSLSNIKNLLDYILLSLTAYKKGHENLLHFIVEFWADSAPLTFIQTPIIKNPAGVLRLAAQSGADLNWRTQAINFPRTPLSKALFIQDTSRKDVLKELVSLGADVFDCVYFHGPSDCVLLTGISCMCRDFPDSDVNARDSFNRTPLMHALIRFVERRCGDAKCGCISTDRCMDWMKVLAELGADFTARDQDGVSAIHIAATTNGDILKCVLDLVDNYDKFIDLPDKTGSSPLHYASFADRADCVKVLLKYGADRNSGDKYGHTPTDIALMFGFKQIISCLSNDEGGAALTHPVIHFDGCPNCRCEAALNAVLQSPLVGCKETQESRAIKQEVNDLVNRIAIVIAKTNPKLSFEVKLRGSSVEGTKIGFPDEFDFSLVMNDDKASQLELAAEDLHQAQETLLLHLGHFRIDYKLPKKFHLIFLYTLFLTLNQKASWQGLRLKLLALDMGKVGPQVLLQWNGATYKHMIISLDLIPMFVVRDLSFIPVHWPAPIDFSGCEKYYMLNYIGHIRYTYSDMEKLLMDLIPPAATDAYKFLKAFRSPYLSASDIYRGESSEEGVYKLLPSYLLKNLILRVYIEEVEKGCDTDLVSATSWVLKVIDKGHITFYRGHNGWIETVCGDESIRVSRDLKPLYEQYRDVLMWGCELCGQCGQEDGALQKIKALLVSCRCCKTDRTRTENYATCT